MHATVYYCLCLGAFVWLCIYFGLPEEGMAGAACIGVWEDDRSEFARGWPSISPVPLHGLRNPNFFYQFDQQSKAVKLGGCSADPISACLGLSPLT